MVTIISIILGGIASLLLWRTGSPGGMWTAVGATALAFWSAGVMHNYATERALSRHQRLKQIRINEGASARELEEYDLTPIHPSPDDIAAVPNGITKVNMVANLAIVALLVWSLVQTVG